MKKTLLAALIGMAFAAGSAQAAMVCALPDNQATVQIGHLATTVPNLDADGAGSATCTINDLIREEDTYANQAAWIAHVNAVIDGLPAGSLNDAQKDEIRAKAAAYDIKRYQRVKVLSINDFHGQLVSPGTVFSKAAGGVEYLGGYVSALRAKNPNGTVFVSAGDLIGASPLVSALFHDEPTVEAMNRIGLEFDVVGNHEFDEGKAEILRMQNGGCHPTDTVNTCKGAAVGTPAVFEGAKFKFLSANVDNTETGATLFPPYAIKVINGVRVAFIGVVLEETPTVVTPTGVAGLNFKDEADSINALIAQVRNRGAESIVVVMHQGSAQSPTPATLAAANGCTNLTGPVAGIVSRLDGAVDAVVTAHSHQWYNCKLPVASGKLVPVTQAGSTGVGVTENDLTIDRTTRDVVGSQARNLLVDRTNTLITPVAAVKTLTDNYSALVAPFANQVIGSITDNVCNGYRSSAGPCAGTAGAAIQATFADGVSAAGALIADAQLEYTQRPGFGDAVVAFMNVGGVRDSFVYPQSGTEGNGNVTYAEAFTVQPFGNSLVSLTLTGAQIEQVLEQQFAGCNGQTTNRILQPSVGLRYEYSASAPACAKIDPASITLNGVVIDPAASYRVSVNNFLADGGDGFTVFKQGTDRLGGAQDLDALVRYLDLHPAYAPVDFTIPANKRAVKLP